jgi:hypothetical protein
MSNANRALMWSSRRRAGIAKKENESAAVSGSEDECDEDLALKVAHAFFNMDLGTTASPLQYHPLSSTIY